MLSQDERLYELALTTRCCRRVRYIYNYTRCMGISGGLKQLLLVKVHSLNVWEHLIGCAITVEHFVLTKLMGRKVIHCDTSYILYWYPQWISPS